jgi:AcrR family transcriptional regulator
MVRIVKNPGVRRLEIIQAAERLFEQEGYTKTSVESIIKKTGIAKGTFYHYFKAKKDVLEALVERIGIEMETYFNSIIEAKDLTSIQKLKLMLKGKKKKKITSSAVMKIIHKPENRELQEKLNVQSINVIAPLLTKVLQQGKQEGFFTLSPSIESVQLILAGSEFILSSGLFILPAKKRVAFLKSAQNILELLVGAKPGTFSFISKNN